MGGVWSLGRWTVGQVRLELRVWVGLALVLLVEYPLWLCCVCAVGLWASKVVRNRSESVRFRQGW